jgi:formiminotetrahydrofolate cyclodeaminase
LARGFFFAVYSSFWFRNLEYAMSDMLGLPVRQFAAATAAKTPIPGGGSVAGVVGALSAALGEMAVNFTLGKKDYQPYEQANGALAARLARARGMFEDLTSDDMAAYSLYQESAKADDARKQTALAAAINVPREMATLALAVLGDLVELSAHCNRWLLSDCAAGAALAEAVVRLCDYTVRVNTPALADRQAANDLQEASDRDCRRAEQFRRQVEQAAFNR